MNAKQNVGWVLLDNTRDDRTSIGGLSQLTIPTMERAGSLSDGLGGTCLSPVMRFQPSVPLITTGTDTVGRELFKNSATLGWRISLRRYVRQYEYVSGDASEVLYDLPSEDESGALGPPEMADISETRLARSVETHEDTVRPEEKVESPGEPVTTDHPLLSFCIPTLATAGAEQVTVTLINGLVSRGYSVELLLSRSEGELMDDLAEEVSVVELRPRRPTPLGVAAHLPALVWYLRQRNPAALFCHLSHTNVVCLAANRIGNTGTAIIPTEHLAFDASPNPNVKSRIAKRMASHLYPTADRIIAVSEGVARSLVERTSVRRDDISVLYNPIDVETVRERARFPVEHEWVTDDSVDVILSVGRLEHQKDHETWLRAFKHVHQHDNSTRAIIIGKGSRRQEIQAFVDRLDITEVVSMPGYVENPYGYMQRADVFFLSSRTEGLPTVLIEALACGCPIVSTDCPCGPREILANGEYGRLAPVGDVAALADAITETLDDSGNADERRRRADDFAPGSILDDYERFIENHVFEDSPNRQ